MKNEKLISYLKAKIINNSFNVRTQYDTSYDHAM